MASSSSSSSEEKKLILTSSDNQTFEVTEAAALLSETIKNMVEDDVTANGIPLPNVDSKILAKVFEFCNRHAAADAAETLKEFGEKFIKSLEGDQAMLFDLILAADYLNIKALLDLTLQTVADMMRGKKPEEIRELFHIKNDYTPEEEAEVRKDNAWAFDQ